MDNEAVIATLIKINTNCNRSDCSFIELVAGAQSRLAILSWPPLVLACLAGSRLRCSPFRLLQLYGSCLCSPVFRRFHNDGANPHDSTEAATHTHQRAHDAWEELRERVYIRAAKTFI